MSKKTSIQKRTPGSLHPEVSRRREEQALEALVALALRNDTGEVTAAEINRYMEQPVKLSKEDEAALRRARPKLLAALRQELRPDAKRLNRKWRKPATPRISQAATTHEQQHFQRH